MGVNEDYKDKGIKSPVITVIIRTHNSANFVKNAIESTLNQTYPKELCEILVVDDGSTDNTKEILKSYEGKIRILEEKNLGPVKAANLGITNSKGGHVILLDSDDTFEQTILEEMLAILDNNNKDVGFVYCDYYEKNQDTGDFKMVPLRENIFNSVAGGIMFKKVILEEMGGYDEDLIFPEYDLLIKIMKKYKGKHIHKPLFTYVRHKKSLTANRELVKKGVKQLFDRYGEIKALREY